MKFTSIDRGRDNAKICFEHTVYEEMEKKLSTLFHYGGDTMLYMQDCGFEAAHS